MRIESNEIDKDCSVDIIESMVLKILWWYNKYQGSQPVNEMVNLYENLLREESDEFKEAIIKGDIVWICDAIWDIIVVDTIYTYLYQISYNDDFSSRKIDSLVTFAFIYWDEVIADIVWEIMNSNFTKSSEFNLEWEKIGKVIKWPNYKGPDLTPIIEKHWLLGTRPLESKSWASTYKEYIDTKSLL